MGCSQSTPEDLRNKEIEAELSKEKALARRIGKSTVLRQMALLSGSTHSEEDRLAYREIIYSNAVQSMQVVLEALPKFDNLRLSPQNLRYAELFNRLDVQPDVMDRSGNLRQDMRDGLVWLWSDPAIQYCVSQSFRFQLNDSASYFFNEAARIGARNYVPTDADILRSRVKTTGITEARFQMSGKLSFRCFDVGGQRSERKKWIHCFENVNVVFFVVAISEFNQQLREDETTNRVAEACILFDSIANSRWFINSGILLFLNKTDLLRTKLLTTAFKESFPEFDGQNTPTDVQAYMLQLFQSLYRHQWRELYAHFTCATDTQAMAVVMTSVENHIVVSNLNAAGMM